MAASILFYYLAPFTEPALGASGAIFGLLGAWFVVAKQLRLDSRWLVTVVVLNLVFDLALRSQIAWQAHVGGLITGGLLTAAFVYAPRRAPGPAAGCRDRRPAGPVGAWPSSSAATSLGYEPSPARTRLSTACG